MANQFLGLSLFIMLLSFFIILNAISTFETTKTQPVLNSLSVAFSKDHALDPTAPGKTTLKSDALKDGSTLDKIEGLFKAQITGVETKQNRLGTIMYVRMPFKAFSSSVISSLTTGQNNASLSSSQKRDFLPLLVSLLETGRSVTYKMDMILGIEEEPAQLALQEPGVFKEFNRSISKISEKIEQAGLPKKQISSGLKKGQPEIVDLIFRRYEPFSPTGTGNVRAEETENAQ